MDSIRGIVRNIAVVILLASFLELLLPNNSMRRFVQLVMGLFILMAILDPITNLFNQPLAFDIPPWSPKIDAASEQNITQAFQQGQSIRQQSQQAAMEQYKQVLDRQVRALALTVPGVEKLSTEIKAKPTGEIESLKLLVGQAQSAIAPVEPVSGQPRPDQPPANQTPKEKRITGELKTRLGALLDVPEDKISVSFKAAN